MNGSVLSIRSKGSVLSIDSVGSVLSIGLDEFIAGAATLSAADMSNRRTYEAGYNDVATSTILDYFRARRSELVERLEQKTHALEDQAQDLELAAFLRSPYAHGVIKGINTEAAKGMPGVLAIGFPNALSAIAFVLAAVVVPAHGEAPITARLSSGEFVDVTIDSVEDDYDFSATEIRIVQRAHAPVRAVRAGRRSRCRPCRQW